MTILSKVIHMKNAKIISLCEGQVAEHLQTFCAWLSTQPLTTQFSDALNKMLLG